MILELAIALHNRAKAPRTGRGRPRKVENKNWDELSADEQAAYIQQAENFNEAISDAGFVIVHRAALIQTQQVRNPLRVRRMSKDGTMKVEGGHG